MPFLPTNSVSLFTSAFVKIDLFGLSVICVWEMLSCLCPYLRQYILHLSPCDLASYVFGKFYASVMGAICIPNLFFFFFVALDELGDRNLLLERDRRQRYKSSCFGSVRFVCEATEILLTDTTMVRTDPADVFNRTLFFCFLDSGT